jgi:hypothetical protein
MIDRVADAIGEVLSKDRGGFCLVITTEEQRIELARAVIEEMREPTDSMCDSPADAGNASRAKAIWKAMIDEALR